MAGRVQGIIHEGDVNLLPTLWNRILPYSCLPRRAGTRNGSASPMEYQDKVLKCIDCGTEFVFTAGEQLFFHDKQFKNEPKRCKACKSKRVAVLGAAPPPASHNHHYTKVETTAIC